MLRGTRRRRPRCRPSCRRRHGRTACRCAPRRRTDRTASWLRPTGTTSVWPAKQICGAPVPRRANRFSISPKRSGVTAKPSWRSASASTACAPASAGVTEAQRISACASGKRIVECHAASPPPTLPRASAGEGAVHSLSRACAEEGRGEGAATRAHQSRSNSLIEVFARVCSSTVLTMTAQYSDGPGEPSGSGRPGSDPGTTTEYDGTRPMWISPGRAIHHLGRGPDEHPHRQHAAALHHHALGDLGPGADEAVVLDDHRIGLQRLQHAANADAAGQMAVGADLRAASDRRPGIHHRVAPDIGADIDEARHQHRARRDVGRAPHHRAGHRAEARLAEAVLAPAGEFQRHLVPHRRAARPLHRRRIGQPERQQHRLLQPLVDLPARPGRLRHASRAASPAASSAASTASRASPPVADDRVSRRSQSSSIGCCSACWLMRWHPR